MVKTVKGLLTLKELKALLTKYAQTQQSYRRVVTDQADITFYENHVTLRIIEPKKEKCYYCEGTGTVGNTKCWICEGTGIRETTDEVYAKITEKDYGLKIEVNTNGSQPEIWKPDVEKIKNFINSLAGKPCVIIPTSKSGSKAKTQIKTISEILTQAQRKIVEY
jgi:RecJ-like exonuclease